MESGQQDIQLAQNVYESLSVITNEGFGPYTIMNDQNSVQTFEKLRPQIEYLINQNERISERVFQVPSPWHAALFLRSIQENFSRSGERMLFRGQYNSGWDEITPSISRATDKNNETRKGHFFCDILSSLSLNNFTIIHPYTKHELNVHISPDIYLAAAQHYGISTNLIDFTTDPAIAVFFACRGDESNKGKTSSVYVLSRDNVLEKGLKTILPPPFVERLYLQRGVFVQSDCPLNKTDLSIIEVRFPTSSQIFPFEVIRSVGKIDVLQETPVMEKVCEMSEMYFDKTEPDITNLGNRLKKSFPVDVVDVNAMWMKYVDFIEEHLYWLVYRITNSSLIIDLEIFNAIKKDNKEIFASIASTYQWLVKLPYDVTGYSEEKKQDKLKLAKLFQD